MFVNLKSMNTDEMESDICIIGAGIAGLSIAREFLGTQKSVIVLESGDKEPNLKNNDLTSGRNIGLPYYDLTEARARAFGGTSHYLLFVPGLRLRGLDSIDFEKKEWVPYSGWPFGKSELDPYYQKAHELLEVGPYKYKLEDWIASNEVNYLANGETDIFSTTMFQFARKELFYSDWYDEICRSENIKICLNSTVLSIVTDENAKEVSRLEVTVESERKCTVKSKQYILAAGGLENARLLLLSDKQAKNGLGNDKDLVGRFFMEHPHIWGKKKAGTFFPAEVNKFNPNTVYHYHYREGIPFLGYLILNEDVIRENKLLNITFGIRGESLLFPAGYQEAVSALRNVLLNVKHGKIGASMFRELWSFSTNGTAILYELLRKMSKGKLENWNKRGIEQTGIYMNVMAEQSPNPDSRVLLGNEKDRFGQRKIDLDWRLSDMDLESMKKAMEILSSALQKKGVGHIDVMLSTDINVMAGRMKGGYHHMGTTRMHQDPAQGVVDENCKLHGTENLFIAGSSVFPTSGYANPTLTIVALSIRLADFIKRELG